jgi:hypothetical protein
MMFCGVVEMSTLYGSYIKQIKKLRSCVQKVQMWILRSSVVLRYVDWYIVAEVLQDLTALIFRVRQPKGPWRWRYCGPSTWRNITDELILHYHSSENFKCRKCKCVRICELWGFHSSVDEDSALLVYDSASVGNRTSTFRGNGVASFSAAEISSSSWTLWAFKKKTLRCLDVGIRLSSDTASYATITVSVLKFVQLNKKFV